MGDWDGALKRLVVLPDIHTPNHEEKALAPIFSFIKFYKPHVLIQLGDFCDWDSVSKFLPHSERDIVTIDQEADSANALLDKIDAICKVAGVKKKIMIGGNHEDRYAQYRVNRGMEVASKRMRTFTSWEKEYELDRRGWEHVDYGEHIQIGKIVFTHGWFSGGNCTKQMAECFPGRNVIFGHTHKHQVSGCLDEKDMPIESETIGTLSKMKLSYLRGKPAINWVHGFLYIDMAENGYFTKHYVRIIDGGFIEYGKEFR